MGSCTIRISGGLFGTNVATGPGEFDQNPIRLGIKNSEDSLRYFMRCYCHHVIKYLAPEVKINKITGKFNNLVRNLGTFAVVAKGKTVVFPLFPVSSLLLQRHIVLRRSASRGVSAGLSGRGSAQPLASGSPAVSSMQGRSGVHPQTCWVARHVPFSFWP